MTAAIDHHRCTLGIIGGSGALGQGLATRWLRAGYKIIIGSRDIAKAREAAQHLQESTGSKEVGGDQNTAAASASDIVVITVPFSAHLETLKAIGGSVQGKIVVDTTVPLQPPKVGTVSLPQEGCAAKITQAVLGADVAVVSAFHNVAAAKLLKPDPIDCDVLVCGDDENARNEVVKLVQAAGLHALHAGPLANSAAAEAMTSLLIWINRRYKVEGSGLRITGRLLE